MRSVGLPLKLLPRGRYGRTAVARGLLQPLPRCAVDCECDGEFIGDLAAFMMAMMMRTQGRKSDGYGVT